MVKNQVVLLFLLLIFPMQTFHIEFMSVDFESFLGHKFPLKQQKLTAKIAVVTGNSEFISVRIHLLTPCMHYERYIKGLHRNNQMNCVRGAHKADKRTPHDSIIIV